VHRMNQRPGDLWRSAIVALVFCTGCFEVARSARAGDTQIWFGMGALTSPAGRHSWELLYHQPHPAWPDALAKVTIMGVLTQALVKIPEPELTQFAARLKEKNIGLGVEMLAQAYTPPGCGGGVEGYFHPIRPPRWPPKCGVPTAPCNTSPWTSQSGSAITTTARRPAIRRLTTWRSA
jgi:hypothetical protein